MTPAQRQLQGLLKEKLLQRSIEDSASSLRSFAREIEISAASLSGFLSGNRVPSTAMATKIMEGLQIQESLRQNLIDRWQDAYFQPLDSDEARTISTIYFFAVLELIELVGDATDVHYIADRLQISIDEVEAIIGQQLALGLVTVSETGAIKATGERYTVGDRGPQPDMRAFFMSSLEATRTAIDRLDDEARWRMADTSHMIFGVDPENLEKAKRDIKKFRRELAVGLEKGNRREVYILAINLVPLTVRSKK